MEFRGEQSCGRLPQDDRPFKKSLTRPVARRSTATEGNEIDWGGDVLYFCSTMKTASVRELRNHYTTVMKWIEAGEEVKISKRGKIIARLVPERPKARRKVDWSTSAALTRDKSKWPMISEKDREELFEYLKGRW